MGNGQWTIKNYEAKNYDTSEATDETLWNKANCELLRIENYE